MRTSVTAELEAAPDAVFPVVADLGTYPDWLPLVTRVVPDGDAAWFVTLRAKVGPLARSKRLRMVKVEAEAPRHVRFERHEEDGREHGSWVLDVALTPAGADATTVVVDLRYDGGLWSAPLEAILASQIDEAVPRLAAQVARR